MFETRFREIKSMKNEKDKEDMRHYNECMPNSAHIRYNTQSKRIKPLFNNDSLRTEKGSKKSDLDLQVKERIRSASKVAEKLKALRLRQETIQSANFSESMEIKEKLDNIANKSIIWM